MKFTYKERQDLLWSLRENADRLDKYDEYDDEEADQAQTSAERLRKLASRLEAEL